jgi:hypothetical protein
VLRVHPTHLIDAGDRDVLDVWLAYRRSGMGAVGYLPFAGGYAEQPAALMRAFEAMDAASARIDKKMS